jgi:hypothetical protein
MGVDELDRVTEHRRLDPAPTAFTLLRPVPPENPSSQVR